MFYILIHNRIAPVAFILTYFCCVQSLNYQYESSFTPDHIRYLKNETRFLFKHAWSSYMQYGFPADEVLPDTCEPYGPDYNNIYNVVRNDALGNTSLTILDNLDTLMIMEEWDELEKVLEYLKSEEKTLFNKDTIVQVFETTIRSLGGLLSTHLLLTDVTKGNQILPSRYQKFKEISDKYDGFLLNMAYDLGLKLLPAFKTSTEIPVPRINLAKGVLKVPSNLQKETCTSGAASPVLEFTLLSKLSGDPQFEFYSQLTFWKLWSSRLPLDLMPMSIDPIANKWKDQITGIGASVDSFYEYAAKASILFNDDYMWHVFKTSYKALLTHLVQGGGDNEGVMIFGNVGVNDGSLASIWIDLLGAFWSGLQVLTGQLQDAIKTHLMYLKLWDHFDLIPERWNFLLNKSQLENNDSEAIMLEWYPLRPEFIESTYYLYRATRDPMYLQIGARVLELLQTKYKTVCGFHGLQDIRTGKFQNRMETFVMSETMKYLMLLFDADNEIFLHTNMMNNKNWIFSTEAHPMWFDKRLDPYNFTHSRSADKQDMGTLKNLLFAKMKSKFSRSKRKLTTADEKTFYRNITTPRVITYDMPGIIEKGNVDKIDPLESKFDKCEVNVFNDKPSMLTVSGYYLWSSFFYPDHAFKYSLIKPPYLLKSALDGSCVELTPSFFRNFAMSGPDNATTYHLQCPRTSTTTYLELFLGNIEKAQSVEISRLKYKGKHPSEYTSLQGDDLWVPDFSSLRLKIEKLSSGLVDSQNTLITDSFIQSVRVDDYNAAIGLSATNQSISSTKDILLVLRIKKINGISVKPGQVVWTLPFESNTSIKSESSIGVASDGRVVLQGNVVENLKVWYG